MSDAKIRLTSDLPELLTVREVAEILRVKKPTIRAWIYQKRLVHVRLNPGGKGNCVRVPRSEVELLLNAGFVGVDDEGSDLPDLGELLGDDEA